MRLDLPRSASVLIPTFQAERFLDRVLAALSEQDFVLPWDVHVLDSGSTDGTLAIIASWKGRMPVELEVHALADVRFDHGDASTQPGCVARSQVDSAGLSPRRLAP